MTKKLVFNPLSGLFWCWPWVRAILPCGCETANPFAPRSPITMTSQCCAGQDRKDFLSTTAIDSENVFCCRLFTRGNSFAKSVKADLPLQVRETRVIDCGIGTTDIEKVSDYRVDIINRWLVTFHFVSRVNVAATLIINQMCSVMR